MDYVLWYNACKIGDNGLVKRLSNPKSVDLVRLLTWSGVNIIRRRHRVCTCNRCNGELVFVLLRCTERDLDVALDAGPVLVERTRNPDGTGNNAFVNYSFAHPSTLDRIDLMRILSYTGVNFLYVTTSYDTVSGDEDSSVFKISLVKHKTPGCDRDTDWVASRIGMATHCRAIGFQTRYVSYFSIYGGHTGSGQIDHDGGRGARPPVATIRIAESLGALNPTETRVHAMSRFVTRPTGP